MVNSDFESLVGIFTRRAEFSQREASDFAAMGADTAFTFLSHVVASLDASTAVLGSILDAMEKSLAEGIDGFRARLILKALEHSTAAVDLLLGVFRKAVAGRERVHLAEMESRAAVAEDKLRQAQDTLGVWQTRLHRRPAPIDHATLDAKRETTTFHDVRTILADRGNPT